MLKKYYIKNEAIKAFVDTFHRQTNKLLTAHSRKKLTKILTQLTETPNLLGKHEFLCCSSPGICAEMRVEGIDSEGAIHVSLSNRQGKEGPIHLIHEDWYHVPFSYIRPHSYRHIAGELAECLFPDGVPDDRTEMWNQQIFNILFQFTGINEPASHSGYVERKYLAFDYHYPLLTVTAAVNESIIVKMFCLDEISHRIGQTATLGTYLLLQDSFHEMDALCQQNEMAEPSVEKKVPGRHVARRANRLIDVFRVLRRLTKVGEHDIRHHLLTLLETPDIQFEGGSLTVVAEIEPTLKLTTPEGEWFIALSVDVIAELTQPQTTPLTIEPEEKRMKLVDKDTCGPDSPANTIVKLPGIPETDYLTGENQHLHQLFIKTLSQSPSMFDSNGNVDGIRLYDALEATLNETGPVMGWFRQKGTYVKYRVKQHKLECHSVLTIKIDIIKERPVKRNLVNIDIEVNRDDISDLQHVWKVLWLSLIHQPDFN